ncbi:MAG: hypothetical protein K6E73_12890 [Bacteroidales bacterium]|nr:hypothetical protein [Bacteroidales bacterium]MCR5362886.1 hypothetical protein [Bacteroidales bacterium]
MSNNMEDKIYDDAEAVKFIQSHLPQELQGKYTDDDILLMTDIMVEFYERNGWLDSDDDEEIEIDVEEIVNYVANACKKDKDCKFDTDPESVRWVVEAELDYEESLA